MNEPVTTRLAQLWAAFAVSAFSALGGEPVKVPSTGHLFLTITDRSPLSQLSEVCSRLDIDLQSKSLAASVKATANQYDPTREKLEAFIPPNYQSSVPHGLFVWVGVGPLSPAWFDVFTRQRLLAISAVPAKGAVGFSRDRLPLDAVQTLRQRYTIDEGRVYVAGFSAGAGVAVHLICGFPDVFDGGLFLMGGNFCFAHKTDDGRYEPTLERIAPKWKGPLEQLNRDLRLVLMRAQGDTLYSPQEDAAQYQALLLDGFSNATFIVTPGKHQPPDAFWFEQGLRALESRRTQVVTTQPAQAGPLGPAGQAQRLLATAQLILERKPPSHLDKAAQETHRTSSQERARQYLRQILAEYPATPAAAKARQVLETMRST